MSIEEHGPMPVPTDWEFAHTHEHVIAKANTPMFPEGMYHFIELRNVDKFCEALQSMKAAAENQGVLEVPSHVVLGPDGNPLMIVPPSQEVQEQAQRVRSYEVPDIEVHPFQPSESTPWVCTVCKLGELDGNHPSSSMDRDPQPPNV